MTSVGIYLNANEIWGSHLTQCFVDGIILVVKEREGHLVFLAKKINFEGSVAGTDTNQFDFVFEVFSFLDSLIEFVHPERFFLTKWSVHVKDFDDDHLSPNFGD